MVPGVINQSRDNLKSSICLKYPSYRKGVYVTAQRWLNHKKIDDGIDENLWRIGDNLYDLTSYIDQHPGGKFWLEKTKGSDITEAFHVHHLSKKPEQILKKFKVGPASVQRNYTLTFDDDGFYQTLKRRAVAKLQNSKFENNCKKTNYIHTGLLVSTFSLAWLSAMTKYAMFEFLTAFSICWLTISAHNYFHRADNWRMYTFNFSLMNFCDWRISHVMSHHIFTNSLHDLELSTVEPFLCWIPNKYYGTKLKRIISLMLQPFIYMAIWPMLFIQRVLQSLFSKNLMYWHDVIGLLLPLFMLMFTKSGIYAIIQWFRIIIGSSFIFGLIGLNAAHHDPKIYHDGDARRSDLDWGLYQLDTVCENSSFAGSGFVSLTHFGEHTLHHLFPTLDHGILHQLHPILLQTLKEFKLQFRQYPFLKLVIGQNLQLLRTEPNLIPTELSRN